jgi:nucleotidyltransferase substrate binding protein (TIGR01987 family)
MDRLQERLEQAAKALQALRELTDVRAPSLVQRDAILLRFMLASEAIWKAAQRYLQENHDLEVGSPRESVRTSFEVGLLDGDRSEQALVLLKDRNLVVHAYNEALADEVMSRIHAHVEVLGAWLDAMGQA